MLQPFKKLSEEVVQENPWWKYKRDTFETNDGTIGEYNYGEGRGSAMVIPVLPDGKIVMVEAIRYIWNRESIEFPCGGREPGESKEQTAKRELLEETGAVIKNIQFLGTFQGMNGTFDSECSVFLAKIDSFEAPERENTERIETRVYTKEEVDGLIRKNTIWDGHTIAAWCLARPHLFS